MGSCAFLRGGRTRRSSETLARFHHGLADIQERSRAMFERAVTNGIQVEVESFFVPEHSNKTDESFFFSYRIRIQNSSPHPVQLISRHWTITDGRGHTEEIRGAGVIGQQPQLQPGESFEYESFCPLGTPTGTMKGRYEMLCLQTGDRFDAEIPQFFLVEPNSYH